MKYLVIGTTVDSNIYPGHTVEGGIHNGWCGEDIYNPHGSMGAGGIEEKHVILIGPSDDDKKKYHARLAEIRNEFTTHCIMDAAPKHGELCKRCERFKLVIDSLEKYKRWFE